MKLLDNFVRSANLTLNFAKNHIDVIEMIAGDVAIVAGAVMIAKHAQDIVDVQTEAAQDKDFLKATDEEIAESTDPTVTWETAIGESRNHYILRTGCKHAAGYLKATWVGDLLIAGGMALNGIAHATVQKQLESTMVALASTTYTFNEYRKRVRADVGEQKDYEYLTGTVLQKTIEVDEQGHVTETTLPLEAGQTYIPHGFFFSATSNYDKSPRANRDFQESVLWGINRELEMKGLITENKARELLGAPLTTAGQNYVFYYQNPDGTTNHVSLGWDTRNDEATQRFKDGLESDVLITLQYDDGREPDLINAKRLASLGWELA